jgi:hypothetical protein
MGEGEGKSEATTGRMPHEDRILDLELIHQFEDQVHLSSISVWAGALPAQRAFGEAEPHPVEGHYPPVFGEAVRDRRPAFGVRSESVQEHKRRASLPPFPVPDRDPVQVDEPVLRRGQLGWWQGVQVWKR